MTPRPQRVAASASHSAPPTAAEGEGGDPPERGRDDGRRRARQAWADANKQIVAQAPAIPRLLDQQLTVHRRTSNAQNEAGAYVEFPFTSLK